MDPQLPEFPAVDTQEPVAFLDAEHANDLRNRRSTTGYAFLLCGGATSYRCKTQSITATSSTEAEFLVAVATVGEIYLFVETDQFIRNCKHCSAAS